LPSSGVRDLYADARWRPAIQERVMAGNRAGLSCGPWVAGLGLRALGCGPWVRTLGADLGCGPWVFGALPTRRLGWRLGAMPCILRPLAAKRRRPHSPGIRR
jgi:hypothetical protein